jgi:hypothetical protein
MDRARMRWKAEVWRGNMRLGSGLVLLAFVICHLTAHAFLLISFESADVALDILMAPWRTIPGTVLLAGAALVHYANALWAIYVRRTLRFSRWEWTQLALGLAIPPLLMLQVVLTRIADVTMGVTNYYSTVLLALLGDLPGAELDPGGGGADGLDPFLYRRSFLVAHEGLVPAMAGFSVCHRLAAAGAGAGRLRYGRQPGAAPGA